MRRTSVLLLVALFAPTAGAAPPEGIDAVITLAPGAEPKVDGPSGLVTLVSSASGERYVFDLDLAKPHTTFEVRARGFDIERPRQLVPSLVVPDTEYPLFNDFPNERVWDVDGPARVFFVNGTADAVVLRLGVNGPDKIKLVLARDVEPPRFTLGPIENVNHFSFYQETRTEELAIGILEVRRVGTDEWVENPTPMLHFRQRFPVQGLSPSAEYEARVTFLDWAQNRVTSDTYVVRTTAQPVVPRPTVVPLSPEPNATVGPDVVIRARIVSNESPVVASAVSVFLDKRAAGDAVRVVGDEVIFTPPSSLAPGRHSVAVEATNEAGGRGEARWTFEVGSARSPVGAAPLLALAFAALVAARRR